MTAQGLIQLKPEPAELRRLWHEAAFRRPGVFASDVAAELGISEAELIASRVDRGAIRLSPRWHELLGALTTLGPVKAVTQNAHAVIKKEGVYPQFRSLQMYSIFLGEEIDLRINLGHWAFAFAYEALGSPINSSIQFYSRDGVAVHKLFLKQGSSAKQFYSLVAQFQDDDQSDSQEVAPQRPMLASRREVEKELFLAAWSELQDIDDFLRLLGQYQVTRLEAMQLAEGRFTRKVSTRSPRSLLANLSRAGIPVMVFVKSRGCLQIHKGPLKNVIDEKGWLSVIDPGVEINLREAGVAHAWVVEKPTSEGRVYSFELFDAGGGDIASLLGVRREGKRQDEAWQEILSTLPGAGDVA
jgi:putative hemin transport protein